ncbi:hypothetical protein JR316_0012197 [Psilocybe cubensis]|uniref:Uncharacterized protein n=2 Tax=Psilocybe cubensis TaxID=181762 RepID=A0ACB8GH86_PSICU|nr:hypothetical protein JR316_0012197 [Psilocybe cubensis]KAH9475090.1 hypothetical protein JR316_0012197 [Psilocybe cubensis]
MAHVLSSSLSLEEIWDNQSFSGILALNACVVFGIVLWDFIQLLPEERSLYEVRRRREWRVPGPWAFVILRYSALLSTLSGVIYSTIQIHHCQLVVSFSQGASVICTGAMGIIFCARVGSLWDYKRIPLYMALGSCVLMIAAWVCVAVPFKATAGPALPFGGNCKFGRLADWTPVSYAASAAFNCIIFGLFVIRVTTKTTVVATNTGFTLINRACILYLFCGTVASIVVLTIYSINWSTELVRRATMPYSILFMATMGSRVFLNLQLHNHTLTRVAESNHFTAPSWSRRSESEKALTAQVTTSSSRTYDAPFNSPTAMSATRGLDVMNADVRSLNSRSDAYTIRTALTVPETPATMTSFGGSTNYTESSYGMPLSTDSTYRSLSAIPRSHARVGGGSMRSYSSSSTRQTDATSPKSPRSTRTGSVKSYATTSTSGQGTPKSPRRVKVPRYSAEISSSQATAATRTITTTLPTENLKSTWHGV